MRGKRGNGKRGIALYWRFDAAVVVLLVAGMLLAFSPRSKLEPTGDQLYDDYAKLFIKQFNRAYPNDFVLWVELHIFKCPNIRDVDLSEVKCWEEKYADDPRYWQLRRDSGADGAALTKVFEDSIRRGVYDEASFYYSAWHPDRSYTTFSAQECYDPAIALNPDNAYYYYMKAFYYLHNRRYDDSWEALKQGNAASECYIPHQFPDCFILENYAKLRSDEDKLVAAVTHAYTPFPDTRMIKQDIQQMRTEPEDLVSNEYLDDLAWAELRLLRAEKGELIIQMFLYVCYRSTVCDVAAKRMQLSPAQASEYAYIRQRFLARRNIVASMPDFDMNLTARSACINYFNEFGKVLDGCQQFAALTDGWPRHPLTAWSRGELAGYPVPADFQPLPKYLPQAE
jgi:hypothetical protein